MLKSNEQPRMSSEEIDALINEVTSIRTILIDVGTGQRRIQDGESEYNRLRSAVSTQLRGLAISDPNTFQSLWDWYGYWKAQGLNTYQSRRQYAIALFSPVIAALEASKGRFAGQRSEQDASNFRRRAEAKRVHLREILSKLSRLRLCGPSDDPDEQTAVTESYKYLLTHVKRLSKGLVSAEVRRELDPLSADSIESIYDVYNSKAHLDAIAIDIAYDLDNRTFDLDQSEEQPFISPLVIEKLEGGPTHAFDLTKLLGYCREINSSFQDENVVACLLLMRTVLNHVPPIFGHATFAQVTANAGKSLRDNFEYLDRGLRKLADLYAHQPIRNREQYPTKNQVEPFRPQFEILLHEVFNRLK